MKKKATYAILGKDDVRKSVSVKAPLKKKDPSYFFRAETSGDGSFWGKNVTSDGLINLINAPPYLSDPYDIAGKLKHFVTSETKLDLTRLPQKTRDSFEAIAVASMSINVKDRAKNAIRLGAPFMLEKKEIASIDDSILLPAATDAKKAYQHAQQFEIPHLGIMGMVWYQPREPEAKDAKK